MKKDDKKRRGGARPGAGRPRGDSKMISFRAPGHLAERLEGMENRTEFIRQALTEAVMSRCQGPMPQDSATKQWFQNPATKQWHAPEPASRQDRQNSLPGAIIPAEKAKSFSLPFFDIKVVAGFPVPLDNDERSRDIDILTMLCPHPEASYLIRVSGDSMIDAGLLNGDIVIVDKSNRNPSPHEIAMCELNGEYTLKHLILENGQGWLVPANPEYPRIPITPEDDFSVWGTVTYIIHKAREQ